MRGKRTSVIKYDSDVIDAYGDSAVKVDLVHMEI